MKLKVILRIVLIVMLAMAVSSCTSETAAPESAPTGFQLSDGSITALSEYQGQWLVINYWAIWCGPCVKEIPELNAVDKLPNVSVLGFNFDKTQGEELAKQLQQLKVEFGTVMNDPASLFDQPMPTALPATMIIDPNGNFKEWLMGPQTKNTILEKLG